MNRDTGHHHRQSVQRAIELGCGTDPAALAELVQFLTSPSAVIRSLAASAIGKLAGFGLDDTAAVRALVPVALHDPDPPTRERALRSLKTCGAAARECLPDLDTLGLDENAGQPVRRAAQAAAESIRAAVRHHEEEATHRCKRCSRPSSREEHLRSQLAFQRTFCDGCFDEIFFERRTFEPEG